MDFENEDQWGVFKKRKRKKSLLCYTLTKMEAASEKTCSSRNVKHLSLTDPVSMV